MVDTVWGPVLTLGRSEDLFCDVAVVVSERLCGGISAIPCVVGSGFKSRHFKDKIVYVDMDDVLADFKTGIEKLSQEK